MWFDELGMHDTGVHDSTAIYKHEATGYSIAGDEVKKALDWDMSRAGGAGNLYSTVNDLRSWNDAIFSGKLLNEESVRVAHTVNEVPESDGIQMPYGYGWMMDEFRGLQRISHSGGLQGFVSQLTRFPELDVTVVALHNAFPSVPELSPQRSVDVIAEAFLWKEMKPRPKYILATDVDPETYDDYVGKYDYLSAILTVSRDGKKLMAQLTGQPPAEIFPAGDDKFFWKVVDAQVEFIRDSTGNVTSARHTQGISKFVAARVKEQKEVELPEEILDRYVGKYGYPGSGRLTVRREGQQLFAQMTGQPEFKLFPKSETEFFWRVVNAEIKFEVDDEGKVVKATHYQAGQELPVKKIDD